MKADVALFCSGHYAGISIIEKQMERFPARAGWTVDDFTLDVQNYQAAACEATGMKAPVDRLRFSFRTIASITQGKTLREGTVEIAPAFSPLSVVGRPPC